MEAGEAVVHEECAARAALLQAPDYPDYEDLLDLTDDERRALPARFHTPQFDALGKPNAWLCAVCWGDGWVTQWPCKAAQENGTQVFTHAAFVGDSATELVELRARVSTLSDELSGACLARFEEEQENARLRLAWHSARERAQAYREGILRQVANRDAWMGWAKEAQAEVQRLLAERHTTNEALSDAAEMLRVQRDRIAELEARLNAVAEYATSRVTGPEATNEVSASWVLHLLAVDHDSQNPIRPCGCSKRFDRHAWGCPTLPADDVPLLRQPEDPHDSIPTFSASEIARWQARQLEDPHTSELHHEYALGRDLPVIPQQTTGRCPRCRRLFEDCTCGGGS